MAKEITTNLDTTQDNIDILEGLRGQLSDGIWENTYAMRNAWRYTIKDVNGKITLSVPTAHGTPYYQMSNGEILAWFARKVKAVFSHEQKYFPKVGKLTADNQNTCKLFHGSVPVYAVAEAIKTMNAHAKTLSE